MPVVDGDWVPPARKRERGSRSLGEQAAVPVEEPAAKSPRSTESPRVRKDAGMVSAKAAAAAAAAEEAAAWELAEGLVLTNEQNAMLRILIELFSPKYHSFSRPFVVPSEAESNGIELGLPDIRKRFMRGEFEALAPFCAEVRDVFARCYMAHGHPDDSSMSKRCARLDEVFEQNVTLLPRSLRDATIVPSAIARVLQTVDGTGGRNAEESEGAAIQAAEEQRRSGRQKKEVLSNQGTLQMVVQVMRVAPSPRRERAATTPPYPPFRPPADGHGRRSASAWAARAASWACSLTHACVPTLLLARPSLGPASCPCARSLAGPQAVAGTAGDREEQGCARASGAIACVHGVMGRAVRRRRQAQGGCQLARRSERGSLRLYLRAFPRHRALLRPGV